MSSYSLPGHYSNLFTKNSIKFWHRNIAVPHKLGIGYKRDGNLKRQCTLQQ